MITFRYHLNKKPMHAAETERYIQKYLGYRGVLWKPNIDFNVVVASVPLIEVEKESQLN